MTQRVLALIPARGGSKSIPRKNIKPMAGIPLIAFSIVAALEAKMVNRIVVSTDDQEIADVAQAWGAEIPFLRPSVFAGDYSTDLDVFRHALTWFTEHEHYYPDICVHLRPTYPVREDGDIDAVIIALLNNPDFDSVRSVALAPETPFKMWFLDDNQLLSPVVECDVPEAYNQPRQILPPAYLQNACIDAVRSKVITTKNSMTGSKIMGFVMGHNYDVDTEQQFERVEQELIRRKLHLSPAIHQRLKANG